MMIKQSRVRFAALVIAAAWPLSSQAAPWQASVVDAQVQVKTATDCRTHCTPDQHDETKTGGPGMVSIQVLPSSRSEDASDPSTYNTSMLGMANVIFDLNTPGREFIHVYATANAHYEGDWAAHDPADVAAHIAPASATGDADSTLTFKIDAPLSAALTGTAFNGGLSLFRLGTGGQADEKIFAVDAPTSTGQSGPLALVLQAGTYRASVAASVHKSWFDVPPNPSVDATGAGSSAYLLIKAIPEPSTTALMMLGLIGVAMAGAKRTRSLSRSAPAA